LQVDDYANLVRPELPEAHAADRIIAAGDIGASGGKPGVTDVQNHPRRIAQPGDVVAHSRGVAAALDSHGRLLAVASDFHL
jgi:hypothetical protein